MTKPSHKPTKRDTIQRLVSRPSGVKLATLCKATGWQTHSVRAALSALRKDGVAIARRGTGATALYRLAPDEVPSDA
jgi:DNA-binding transcriptional regulator PaaX